MTGAEYLTHLAAELTAAREIRYQAPEVFDDLSPEALETAARGLRAISYSAEAGARHLGRIAAERRRVDPVSVATDTAPGEETGSPGPETGSPGPKTFEGSE